MSYVLISPQTKPVFCFSTNPCLIDRVITFELLPRHQWFKKKKKTERRPILIFPFFFVTYLIFPFRFLNLDLVFSVSTPGQWASYPSSGEHPAGWLTRLYLGQCLDRLFAPRPKRGVGVKGATGEKESFSALTDWKEVSISFASRSTCVYWFLSISLFFFFFC